MVRPPLYFPRDGKSLFAQMRALFPTERTAKVRWATADRWKVALRPLRRIVRRSA